MGRVRPLQSGHLVFGFYPLFVNLEGKLAVAFEDAGSQRTVMLVDQIEQDSLLLVVDLVNIGDHHGKQGHHRFGSHQGFAIGGAIELDDGDFVMALGVHGVETALGDQVDQLIGILFKLPGFLDQSRNQILPDGDDFLWGGFFWSG